eukprot:TRINITY_DN2073_c0_g1_i1.p1 TRINITY_DN2073_c0_g1~~TRINITY_DN2073_c0_g1_i1.p1  ORF type:complete len:406 (+),score=96.75 TRINITY_DN2073_c0_g1_i1:193-1410(+)
MNWRSIYHQYLHPDRVLRYSTPKVVEIRNWKLGLLHYSIVLLLLLYTIVYAIILEHGYQGVSEVVGSASARVEGSAFQDIGNGTRIVWDEHDIEQNAIFLTTNAMLQKEQTRGIWPAAQFECESDDDCQDGLSTNLGILNGTCDTVSSSCFAAGWGPIPVSTEPSATTVLDGVQNFGLYIPCAVYFPAFGKKADNVMASHHEENVNYFPLASVFKELGVTYDEISTKGALLVAQLNWDCEFDWWSSPCKVDWSFRRIDNVSDDEDNGASGFSVQRQDYYRGPNEDGEVVQMRDAYYLHGIRIIFLIDGIGRRFDIVPCVVTFGSGIALIAIGSLVSDFCALNIFPSRDAYTRAKYVRVRARRYGNFSESDSDVFTDSDDDLVDEKGKVRSIAMRNSDGEQESLLP